MDAPRFDALARSLAARPSRRRLVRAVAALGLGGFLGRVAVRPMAAVNTKCTKLRCPKGDCLCCEFSQDGECGCKCCKCTGGGIVGGGSVRTTGGAESTLVLLATRTANSDEPGSFAVEGHVRWTDPAWEGAGLVLESTAVAFYAPLTDIEGGRVVSGWMRSEQRPGEFPFVLRAVDVGPSDGGQDTVELWVGDAVFDVPSLADVPVPAGDPSSFQYAAGGVLVAGDLHLVDVGSSTAAPAEATPTA